MTDLADVILMDHRRKHPTYPPPADPVGVARQFVARHYTHIIAGREFRSSDDRVISTLRHHRGFWYAWDGGAWSIRDRDHIRAQLYAELEVARYDVVKPSGGTEARKWLPNDTKINHVYAALKSTQHLSSDIEAPEWLDDTGEWLYEEDPTDMVAVQNGIVCLRTGELIAHTPDYFNDYVLPFEWDIDAPFPTAWNEFLCSVWSGDQESATLLQEWFGYVLSGRTDLQKILLLLGPPRSGKGTILRILQELVGDGNHASPSMSAFSDRFGLTPLIGKPLAIVADARMGSHTDVSRVVEMMLNISGEDSVTLDRKNRDAWTGTLPTRIIVSSNEVPRFVDPSGAIASRFVVLKMTRSFLGQEDPDLGARLAAELPSIFMWAMTGVRRLEASGRLTEPESSADVMRVLRGTASAVSEFLDDCCTVDPDAVVEIDALFRAWQGWALRNGIERAGTAQDFGRKLRTAVPGLTDGPRSRTLTARTRTYRGVGLVAGASTPALPPGLGQWGPPT